MRTAALDTHRAAIRLGILLGLVVVVVLVGVYFGPIIWHVESGTSAEMSPEEARREVEWAMGGGPLGGEAVVRGSRHARFKRSVSWYRVDASPQTVAAMLGGMKATVAPPEVPKWPTDFPPTPTWAWEPSFAGDPTATDYVADRAHRVWTFDGGRVLLIVRVGG